MNIPQRVTGIMRFSATLKSLALVGLCGGTTVAANWRDWHWWGVIPLIPLLPGFPVGRAITALAGLGGIHWQTFAVGMFFGAFVNLYLYYRIFLWLMLRRKNAETAGAST